METVLILLVCAIAAVSAQFMTPYQTMGMGPGMGMGTIGNPMWRNPGWMQTSHVSSMAYPTWRSHPLFRMAAVGTNTEKSLGATNLPQDVLNIPKVPSTQEVLTHMALANQNPKPYYDTISDFLYDPQKARNAIIAPMYLQRMDNMMRAQHIEDCDPQEAARLNRAMTDWLY